MARVFETFLEPLFPYCGLLDNGNSEKIYMTIELVSDNDIEISNELFGILSPKDIEDFLRMEKERKKQSEYHKKNSKCRNKGIDPRSSIGIGYITEVLVSKFLGIPTCFKITDKFNYPKYDMLEHEDWGKINTKGSSLFLFGENMYWKFHPRRNKYPDFFFCIGYDKDIEHVLCVYYIPNDFEISNLTTIFINTNWTDNKNPYFWFKQNPKPWDNMFHTMDLGNCPVLSRE